MNDASIGAAENKKAKRKLQQGTLRITLPIGQTLTQSLFFLLLILGAGEIAARTDYFQSLFIAPGVGSQHRQFEIQLERLNRIFRKHGGVDCIFLGNSMVWMGFNPVVFSHAYNEKSGEDLLCINFGVDGLSAAAAGPLAEILVDKYHPKLLIYGTDPRDFAVPEKDPDTTMVLETAWIQYHQSHFSLQGWLFENSYLYRYRISLRDFMRFRYNETLTSWDPENQLASSYGFKSEKRVAANIKNPPSQDDKSGPIQYYFRTLWNYQILPENIAGLRELLNQTEKKVQILVVEMPSPQTYLYFFKNGNQDYQKFRKQIGAILDDAQVPYIPMASSQTFGDESWADYSHMNENGAQVFSQWLGEKLSETDYFPTQSSRFR